MKENDYVQIRLKLCALRLKNLREDQGLTQREMANKLKASNATVHNYEIGKRVPTLEYLSTVAKTFNVSFEWITGGEIDINKSELDNLYDGFSEKEKQELLQFAHYLKERRRLNGS